MAAKFAVTGDQFVVVDDRMRDIKRQLRLKGGSPLDPEQVAKALQWIVEGRFEITTSEEAVEEPASATDYFTPLSNSDAVAALVVRDRSQELAEVMVRAWRSLSTSINYSGPVCWRVKAGFTLKHHAPKAGPCHRGFSHLQDWKFLDEPTKDGIVFWIPRLLEGSTAKNVDEQTALLADTRKRYELPNHHLTSYGSAALLTGLILAHFKASGERVPLNQLWTRTDTRSAGGGRLCLGNFSEDGLDCGDYWGDTLGCFPLGVEH